MPNPAVFSLHTDHTEHHRRWGANTMLTLGRHLLDREQSGRRRLTGEPPSAGEAASAELKRHLDDVQTHVDLRPNSWIKQHLIDPATRKIDPRATQVLAYLSAAHVLRGEQSVGVMRVATACCPPGGTAADLLEMRRVVACLGVTGLVFVDGDSGFMAQVRLASQFMVYLLGGTQCVPYLSNETFCEISNGKQRQAAALAARGEHTDAKTAVLDLLRRFPLLTPRQLYDELGRHGYVGQESARRSMALAAYRHVTRLRRIYLDGVEPAKLSRDNILIRGPTGCGKTLLANTLFNDILKLPCIVADMTTFSETGFVGEELSSILTRLVAGYGDLGELGVVILDEIDKIADPGGMDSGRAMVSRHGVQRSLLKLLEPGIVDVPTELGAHPYRSRRVPFKTGNLLWIGCGAFSNFKRAAGLRQPMGFGAKGQAASAGDAAGVSAMAAYGVLPELYGRFSLDIELSQLSRAQMRNILEQSVLVRFRQELAAADITLRVDDDAIDLLLDRAVARGTGARGLQAEMATALQDAAFEAYSTKDRREIVRLFADGGSLQCEVGRRSSAAKVTNEDIAVIVESGSLAEEAHTA